MSDPLAFGLQIRQRRRAQDLTQAALARRVGCAEITIQKIEAGALRPSRQIVERLAEALALSAEEHALLVQLARREPSPAAPAVPRVFDASSLQIHPLPIPPTPLIGRERETAAVCATLLRKDVRLLTLIGPPGVGKTRLALAAAARLGEHFADGVVFVNLAPLSDVDQVIPAIAHSLNLPERADLTLAEQVKSSLQQRKLLFLLDTFEHLAPAAPQLSQLLAAAGEFKLLVTSRVVLHVSGEHIYGLAPLPAPDLTDPPGIEALAQQPAVALFLARARAVKPDFQLTAANAQAVVALCARLDGLPLAIELAAARSKVFSPSTLLKRLEQRLALLTGGAQDLPTRQQTLRAAIVWSYQLLDEQEQALFARLAVFAGGCTFDAIEAVCQNQAPDTLDLLAMLLDQSLVQQIDDGDGEPRFMLLDTIREFALERLAERGELARVRCRHAEYYAQMAEQAEPSFEGSERSRQQFWLQYFDREHDNVRTALEWCYSTPEAVEYGVRLTAAIWQFWWIRGYLTEGRAWIAQAVAHVNDDIPATASLRAKLLNQAGFLAFSQGDDAAAGCWHQESLVLATRLDDKQAIADAYIGMGNLAGRHSEYGRADELFAQCAALFQELGDFCSLAWALAGRANMARIGGDYARTHALLEESRALFQTAGYSRGLAYVVNNLGQLAYDEGDFAAAHSLWTESLLLLSELAARHGIAGVLTRLGHTALRQGAPDRAVVQYRESLVLCRELADRAGIAANLMGLANVAAVQQDTIQAAHLWGAAERLRESIGLILSPAEQADYTNAVTAARAQSVDPAFAAAWRAGRALSLDEAMARALTGEGERNRTKSVHRSGSSVPPHPPGDRLP
jgi:predicted ATPase/transcriptional regulator with XRE-family HTH domain